MAKHSYTYKFSAWILGMGIGALAMSCVPRGTDQASPYVPVSLNDTSYKAVNAAVLVPAQCIHCHSSFATEEGLAAEVVAGDPEHSPLYTKVVSGEMPKGGAHLSSSQIKMIRMYIEGLKPGEDNGPVIDLKNVTYDVLNKEIFAPRCLNCHDEFAKEEGILGDVEPGDPDHSLLYNFVKSGKMPLKSKKLSDNNIQAIALYINSLPAKSYPPIAPTWASLNANVFQRSCVQCHSAGGPAEKEPFDTYEGVTAFDDAILKKMKDTQRPMPPNHTTMPPSVQLIQAYSDWIDAGEPK